MKASIKNGEISTLFGFGPFDVMTELWFANRAGRQAQLDAVQQPEIMEKITTDEQKFMDRGRQLYLAVREVGMSTSVPRGFAAAGAKILRFSRRARHLSAYDFCSQYEASHAARVERSIAGLIDYRRNYVLVDDPMTFAGGHENHTLVDAAMCSMDLVEEMWCDSPAT